MNILTRLRQWLTGDTDNQRPPAFESYGLTDDEMFLKVREIEPGYYIYRSNGAYYSCGVAGTSWPYFFDSPEGCLHHAFKRFCGGFHTREYKTYRFENGEWIELDLITIRTFADNIKELE